MSRPPDTYTDLSDTLSLCEYKTGGNSGFWLYDETRGMNLSMRAKSSDAAFVKALEYYQRRTMQVEKELKELREKVNAFVESVTPEEED